MAAGRQYRILGRIDNQVKVRGFRIELGEIETKLNMAEHVTEAAVIIRKNKAGENEICAYFTADRKVSVSGLRKTLSQSLPDYMVPAHLIQMDSLPLTPNGKINKKNCLRLNQKPYSRNTQHQRQRVKRN